MGWREGGGEIGNGGVEGRLVLKTHRPDQTRPDQDSVHCVLLSWTVVRFLAVWLFDDRSFASSQVNKNPKIKFSLSRKRVSTCYYKADYSQCVCVFVCLFSIFARLKSEEDSGKEEKTIRGHVVA